MWIFHNATSGAYKVYLRTDAPSTNSITLSQGYMSLVFCDGTYIYYADQGNVASNGATIPPGTIFPFGGASAPSGYLFCDGTTVSRTGYAALFSAIGTLWGVGDGSNTFNLPNLQGAFLRGAGGGLNPSARVVGSYEADTNKSHTHTASVTDPGHKHVVPYYTSGQGTSFSGSAVLGGLTSETNSATTGVTVANAADGGTEAVPKNYAVLYIIKT